MQRLSCVCTEPPFALDWGGTSAATALVETAPLESFKTASRYMGPRQVRTARVLGRPGAAACLSCHTGLRFCPRSVAGAGACE